MWDKPASRINFSHLYSATIISFQQYSSTCVLWYRVIADSRYSCIRSTVHFTLYWPVAQYIYLVLYSVSLLEAFLRLATVRKFPYCRTRFQCCSTDYVLATWVTVTAWWRKVHAAENDHQISAEMNSFVFEMQYINVKHIFKSGKQRFFGHMRHISGLML